LITGTGSPPPQPQPLDCMIGILELQGLLDSQGLHELQRDRPRNIPNIPPLPTPQHSQPVALHVMSATAIRMRSLFMAVISVKNQTDHDASRRSTNSTTRPLMCKFNAVKFCNRPPFSPFHLYTLQTLYTRTVHTSFWAEYNESLASWGGPVCKSTGWRTAVASKNCR
jgi:hypothetical protein